MTIAFNYTNAFLTHLEIRAMLRQVDPTDKDLILRSLTRQAMMTVHCANSFLSMNLTEFSKARQIITEKGDQPLTDKEFRVFANALRKACSFLEKYNPGTLRQAYVSARGVMAFTVPIEKIREVFNLDPFKKETDKKVLTECESAA